jgi:hypothetical protein
MALSWNEIKDRALRFSKEWARETSEDAEAKSFWDDFFNVFGISRRRVATFETRISKLGEKQGYIDLLWKGQLLIEHKSRGKDLDMAYRQAVDYFPGLKEHELPKYILVSDFERFRLYDLDDDTRHEFVIGDFYKNVTLFGFIAGYQKRVFKEEDPVNIKAAELMGKVHDRLREFGYEGHPLEVYLVRLLFILFADDTGIFEKDTFREYLDTKTSEDGFNLGALLAQFFQILNTPREKRLKNVIGELNDFPYINGKLFDEFLPIAGFNSEMRNLILEATTLDWGKISPAIFGSLFQAVMSPEQRRNLGAHYTSEKNILKVIKPLFLDDLRAEFEKVKSDKKQLQEFHKKLSTLKFLDPACGSGNFLIISYRELRLLELDILRELYKKGESFLSISDIVWLNVDQFYGIEIDEFPARIAEVAMWLIDHQMNMRISEEFGQYFARLPLQKSARIVKGNALRLDWHKLISKDEIDITADETNVVQVSDAAVHYNKVNVYSKKVNLVDGDVPISYYGSLTFDYIFGNPPFVGSKLMTPEQRNEIVGLFDGSEGSGVLDYVTGWYVKAAKFIQNTATKCAFVSTNSISQGEQVGYLWSVLFNRFDIKLHFAHKTFKWSNEAKGNAAVYCVIIGFGCFDTPNKRIFEYEDIKGEPHEVKVARLNPYLVEGKDFVIRSRNKPICNVPDIVFGSMPNDNGFLLLTDEEKNDLVFKEPALVLYIRPLISTKEFLNNTKRWCFWLKNVNPAELKKYNTILKRVELVNEYRLKSKRLATRKLASFPTLFGEDRHPESQYILVPSTTSENRKYIPLGVFNENNIANNSCHIIPNGKMYHFGVLSSVMHMIWVSYVCGRLKSDFRYSSNLVYNNFPWPENPTKVQEINIEKAAQKVLDTRAEFPDCSLAALYDPLTMPPKLVKAHQELDRAVDLAYRSQPFTSDANRMEFLFELYEKYTACLLLEDKKKKRLK